MKGQMVRLVSHVRRDEGSSGPVTVSDSLSAFEDAPARVDDL